MVPFVWHPIFIEERSKSYADNGCHGPKTGPKRLRVMEPNLNVVKFCPYPILIAEEAMPAGDSKVRDAVSPTDDFTFCLKVRG